jgi:hypothetical protein
MGADDGMSLTSAPATSADTTLHRSIVFRARIDNILWMDECKRLVRDVPAASGGHGTLLVELDGAARGLRGRGQRPGRDAAGG